MPDEQDLSKLIIRLALDMRDMKEQASEAKESNKSLTEAIKGSWTELQSQYNLVGEYLGTIQQGLDATVGKTVEYAKQVRTMMREVGMSAEDASKLIQVGDDVGVSYEKIELSMRMAIRNGIQPTMEGMENLANQYVAIQDPVEKTRFLMETFGKTGAEMGPLMALGAEGFRQGGAAAEKMGLVMSEQDVKAARALEIAMDDLGDTVNALTLGIGNWLIPKLTEAANTAMLVVNWNSNMDAALNQHNKTLTMTSTSYEAYNTEMRRAVESTGYFVNQNGDYVDVLGNVIEKNFVLSESSWRAARDQGVMHQEVDGLKKAAQEQAPAIQDATSALDAQKAKLDLVMGSTKALTQEMIFQKAAANLDADAALELGLHMGVINQSSYEMQKQLVELRTKYDLNRDGLIDATEAAAGYTDEVARLADFYNKITDKTVTLTVNTEFNNAAVGAGSTGTSAGAQNYLHEHGYASGGSFDVPQGYPNDGWRARFQSGEHVDVTPANQPSPSEALASEMRGLRADLRDLMTQQQPAINENRLARAMRDGLLQARLS